MEEEIRKEQLKVQDRLSWELRGPDGKLKKTGTVEREDGNFRWQHFGPDGKLIAEKRVKNMILDNGLQIIADRLGGTGTQGNIDVMVIGTSNTAVSASQTDIQGTELARIHPTTNSRPSGGTERFVAEFGAGVGTGTIEELVMADTDAASGGRKCLCRLLTGTITKGGGDTWTGTYECTIARA